MVEKKKNLTLKTLSREEVNEILCVSAPLRLEQPHPFDSWEYKRI